MSEKHLVCQGALCKCNFGTTPDTLKVLTQTKHFINDKEGSNKLMATNMDIGASTFEKNTFGPCKMQPIPGGGFKPCQIVVTAWSGFYEKITLQDNNGKALLEDSKATCPIGGPDCITIINHGQTAEVSSQNVENAHKEVLMELFPFVDLNKYIRKSDIIDS
ncbi:DUF4280 domain-containing protein [Kaistella antarctica]|uniref:Predicted chitinase n=1 Tax=Kaistella antarctica TaxID=266748 RepID=A0A448NQS4_9FLAO|nr:DUF4280 domain-containing protein [Kaistella antarctica]KEY18988.1 hypothetical protein HY04_11095 [Kaistella antarctica]SEW12961.1 protein of unknown function [Kaistella antarctica]VEH99123.1 Predicted chitinase [Kaistella antarctica]